MSKLINEEEQLENTLKESGELLVLFYASWCPFSQEFLPVYEKHTEGNTLNSCRVLTDEVETCEEKYDIDVVPTVIYFKNGKISKRLDGIHGRGLNEKQLLKMIDSCGLKKSKQ